MYLCQLLLATVCLCLSLLVTAAPIYKDANASIDTRVKDLLARMTVEEKIGQLMLFSMDESRTLTDGGLTKPFDWYKQQQVGSVLNALDEDLLKIQNELGNQHRLGIPVLSMIDAINGHAFYPGATIFPSSLALSQTWSPELISAVGRVTAKEMTATGFHVTFSPGLDVAKDLRWGRVGETFGEDTYLVSQLGLARIRGYQGNDLSAPDAVAAVPKHLIGYGQTLGGRDATEFLASEREIRQYHLPQFATAIQKGDVQMVMAAYNAVLGEPASTNSWLLNSVLRDELGFDGFVVSDWENFDRVIDTHRTAGTAEHAALQFLMAGNDMAMSAYLQPEALKTLIKDGSLKQDLLDQSVARVLHLKFQLGLFDLPHKVTPDLNKAKTVLQNEEHLTVAYEAAVQSAVLLSNNGILPLDQKSLRKIALVGPNADDIVAQLGDWSLGFRGQGRWEHDVAGHTLGHQTLRQALTAFCNKHNIELAYAPVVDVMDADIFNQVALDTALENADLVIALIGDGRYLAGEQLDRAVLTPSGGQPALLSQLVDVDIPQITVLMSSKPLVLDKTVTASDALIAAFNPGMKGGEALVDLMFGQQNFSGKLTTSFLSNAGQTPGYYNQPKGWHGEGHYADLSPETKYSPFPFGFGLSYSTFEYGPLTVTVTEDAISGSLSVTNSSDFAGTEIIQFYGFDKVASVTRPQKSLVHFDRIDVAAGTTVDYHFKIPLQNFAILNTNQEWNVEPGEFALMVGASSVDIRQEQVFVVEE